MLRIRSPFEQGTASFSEMYSDRIGSGGAGNRKRSVKDRLGPNVDNLDNRSRQGFNKRFCGFDGNWSHDMYDEVDNGSIAKSELISTQDVRSKLNKNSLRGSQGRNETSGGVKDLREKLSGQAPSTQTRTPQTRTQTVLMPQQRSSSAAKATTPGVTTVSGSKPAAVKPSGTHKVLTGVEAITVSSLLKSLGLSKYLISFQAEEIDMSVLRLMKDDDLKEIGIPMGPRKKILLALASVKR